MITGDVSTRINEDMGEQGPKLALMGETESEPEVDAIGSESDEEEMVRLLLTGVLAVSEAVCKVAEVLRSGDVKATTAFSQKFELVATDILPFLLW